MRGEINQKEQGNLNHSISTPALFVKADRVDGEIQHTHTHTHTITKRHFNTPFSETD